MFDAYQEHLDHEDGVAYTDYLVAKKVAIDEAPVRGEDGWSPELEAEREAIYSKLGLA